MGECCKADVKYSHDLIGTVGEKERPYSYSVSRISLSHHHKPQCFVF